MTIGGTTSAVNAGTYYAVFTLKPNYQWPDGSTGAKNVPWTIGKAVPYIMIGPVSLTLTSEKPTGTIAISGMYDYGNRASVMSSDTSVASCSSEWEFDANDNLVTTITGKANGTATITITMPEGKNFLAESKTVEVTVSFGPVAKLEPTAGVTYTSGISGIEPAKLSEYAMAISNNASITNETSVVYVDDGSSHYKISVGDKIGFSISSPVSGWSGVNNFKVIGFNHDELSIKTAYGKMTVTGKAGMTFQSSEFTPTKAMNSSSTNVGGYFKSNLYFFIVNNLLLNPKVHKYCKYVIKRTSAGDKSTDIVENEAYAFLLSEIEMIGKAVVSAAGEGEQYAYYKAANASARVAPPEHLTWARSPVVQNNTSFVAMFNSKSSYKEYATNSNYVSFAMCI